jgi:hypothetical protein
VRDLWSGSATGARRLVHVPVRTLARDTSATVRGLVATTSETIDPESTR